MLERGSGNCSVFRPSYGPLAIDFTASAVADDVRALRAWSEIPASPFLPSFPPSARGASSTFKVPEMSEGRRLVRRVSSPPRRFWAPQKCAPKGAIPSIVWVDIKAPNAPCAAAAAIDRPERQEIFGQIPRFRSFPLSMVRNNWHKDAASFLQSPSIRFFLISRYRGISSDGNGQRGNGLSRRGRIGWAAQSRRHCELRRMLCPTHPWLHSAHPERFSLIAEAHQAQPEPSGSRRRRKR